MSARSCLGCISPIACDTDDITSFSDDTLTYLTLIFIGADQCAGHIGRVTTLPLDIRCKAYSSACLPLLEA